MKEVRNLAKGNCFRLRPVIEAIRASDGRDSIGLDELLQVWARYCIVKGDLARAMALVQAIEDPEVRESACDECEWPVSYDDRLAASVL